MMGTHAALPMMSARALPPLQSMTLHRQAYIRVGGKHVHLGCHDGELAAAQAFDQAAMLRHAHCLGPQSSHSESAALVTNFTPAFYQVSVPPPDRACTLCARSGVRTAATCCCSCALFYGSLHLRWPAAPSRGRCHALLPVRAVSAALCASEP